MNSRSKLSTARIWKAHHKTRNEKRPGTAHARSFASFLSCPPTQMKDRPLWTRGSCAGLGYVEQSPGGSGIHLIGYGRSFSSLVSNESGIEAYAGKRFFTFTDKAIIADSPCQPFDLADYVEQVLAVKHAVNRPVSTLGHEVELVQVDDVTKRDLRSALASMPSDDRGLWIRMGHALRELGNVGRALWIEWSQASEKYEPKDAARVWNSFNPTDTGYQAVFAEAQRQGPVVAFALLSSLLPPMNTSRIRSRRRWFK